MVAMKILEQKQLLSKKISKGLLSGDKLDQGFAKSYGKYYLYEHEKKHFCMRLYSHFVSMYNTK